MDLRSFKCATSTANQGLKPELLVRCRNQQHTVSAMPANNEAVSAATKNAGSSLVDPSHRNGTEATSFGCQRSKPDEAR